MDLRVLPKNNDTKPKIQSKPMEDAVEFRDVCANCDKRGHHLKECQKPRDPKHIKANFDKWKQLREGPQLQNMDGKVKEVISSDGADSTINVLKINQSSTKNTSKEDKRFISKLKANRSPVIEIKVEGKVEHPIVDTGACVSIFNYDYAVERQFKLTEWPLKKLCSVDGSEVTPKYIVRAVEFNYEGQLYYIDCAVIKNVSPAIIIGMDLITKGGMIIDCYHKTITFATQAVVARHQKEKSIPKTPKKSNSKETESEIKSSNNSRSKEKLKTKPKPKKEEKDIRNTAYMLSAFKPKKAKITETIILKPGETKTISFQFRPNEDVKNKNFLYEIRDIAKRLNSLRNKIKTKFKRVGENNKSKVADEKKLLVADNSNSNQ